MSKPKPKIFAKDIDKITRAEWLELRRKGIGGSDAAAICGVNPWRGPLAVYLSKIGATPDTDPNEAMEWGTELEDIIARKFSARTGFRIRRCNMILQHPEYPFMLANIDRYVRDDEEAAWGVLEVKNVSEYRANEWADDTVPDYYNIQVQHYLAVVGAEYAWIAPLIGGNRLRPVKVQRNERLIKSLIKIESDFWELVEKRQPPPLDDSVDAQAILKHVYPRSTDKKVVIDESLYQNLRLAREELEEAERKVRGLENKIKEVMGEAGEAWLPNGDKAVITWKGQSSFRPDIKALQDAEPELCMKYMKEVSMRRFIVR